MTDLILCACSIVRASGEAPAPLGVVSCLLEMIDVHAGKSENADSPSLYHGGSVTMALPDDSLETPSL